MRFWTGWLAVCSRSAATATDRWSAETEILLFTAARRDHLEMTIRPALARGEIVISDRFADSTRIFQGITRGDLSATVDRLHAMMIGVAATLGPWIGGVAQVAEQGSHKPRVGGSSPPAATTPQALPRPYRPV